MKKCSKCGLVKSIDEFSKRSDRKSGLVSKCKDCCRQYYEKNKEKVKIRHRKYYLENREKQLIASKTYYDNNKDQKLKRRKQHYENNKKDYARRSKIYRENHKDQISERSQTYYRNNKEKIAEKHSDYNKSNRVKNQKRQNDRYSADMQYRLGCRLRTRLNNALNGNFKAGSAVRDLGCSLEYLKSYLESKFSPGMTWQNRHLWHIDHIRPLAMFDLTDRAQFLEACNYKNLQPLWAEDNLSKSDSLL